MHEILHKLRKVVLTLTPKMGAGSCGVEVSPNLWLRVNADRYGIRLFADVEAVTDEALALNCPILARQARSLKGYHGEIGFRYKEGSFYFTSVILDQATEEIIMMSVPQQINETQRRDDVRLFSGVEVELEEVDGHFYEYDPPKMESKDLSAGGMRLHCPITHDAQPVKVYEAGSYETPGSELQIRFTLPGTTHTYTTKAEVTWIQRVEKEHEIGLRYDELPQAEQQAIVQYIYREQIREKKRKEGRE